MLMNPASIFYTLGVGESTVQPPDTRLCYPSLFQTLRDPRYRKDLSELFGIETWIRSQSVKISLLTVMRLVVCVPSVVSCDVIKLAVYELYGC